MAIHANFCGMNGRRSLADAIDPFSGWLQAPGALIEQSERKLAWQVIRDRRAEIRHRENAL